VINNRGFAEKSHTRVNSHIKNIHSE